MKFAETDGLYKPVFRGKPMETTLAGRLASAPKAQVFVISSQRTFWAKSTSNCFRSKVATVLTVSTKLPTLEAPQLRSRLEANADKVGHVFVWESCLSNTKNKNMIENWWKQENEMRVRWKWEAPPTWPVSRSSLKWDYLTPPTFPVIAGYGSCKWLVLCLVPLVRQGTRSPIMM